MWWTTQIHPACATADMVPGSIVAFTNTRLIFQAVVGLEPMHMVCDWLALQPTELSGLGRSPSILLSRFLILNSQALMRLNQSESTKFFVPWAEACRRIRVLCGINWVVALFVAFFRSHEASDTYKTHTLEQKLKHTYCKPNKAYKLYIFLWLDAKIANFK